MLRNGASKVEGQMNDGTYKEMPDILNIQEREQIDTIETLIAYLEKMLLLNVMPALKNIMLCLIGGFHI